MQLASAKEQIKLQQKELKGKDAEKAKAKQAMYDVGMTKTAQSLITQLRDVAWALCLEVQGEALNAAGVGADSDLRGTDKVYYPPALRVAPSSALPPPDLSSTSLIPKSTIAPISVPFAKKEKEKQTPTPVMELESKEVAEVEQLKKKKKEKEKEVAAQFPQLQHLGSFCNGLGLADIPLFFCSHFLDLNEDIQVLLHSCFV